jgi:hypothetical protein
MSTLWLVVRYAILLVPIAFACGGGLVAWLFLRSPREVWSSPRYLDGHPEPRNPTTSS